MFCSRGCNDSQVVGSASERSVDKLLMSSGSALTTSVVMNFDPARGSED